MATTTNYSWATPDDTDLVKDGAAAIRTLGSSIDTTVFANAGASIEKTIVDAKGDIIAATAADAVDRLAVGSNGSVLTADSTEATGLKWATPGSAFVGCSLGKSAQTISNNTNTAVAWTSESFDTDAFHDNSTNNTRITIPAGKGGKYSISGVIFYVGTNTNSTGNRNLAVYKNGSYVGDIVSYSAAAAGTTRISLNFAIVLNLVATDYVEIFTDHTAGTAIDVTGSSAAYITYLGA
jgi:hypothetical protein